MIWGGFEHYSQHPEAAWKPFQPKGRHQWDLKKAAHVLRRTAFGASWRTLSEAIEQGLPATIDRLLAGGEDAAQFQKECDGYEKASGGGDNPDALRAWWLYRIIRTSHPLLENLTLFWHNFAGMQQSRIKDAALMADYLRMLRQHALGKVDDLIQALCHHPVFFLQCQALAHRKASPQEGFAGGLLEWLGATNASPADVTALARSFTGWFVHHNRVRFIEREHDDNPKTLFGRTGNWNSREALALILKQPCVAQHVTARLFRWFISDQFEPSPAFLAPLAASFQEDRRIMALIKTMLSSRVFFSRGAYRCQVKSPLAFAMGIIKALEGRVATLALGKALAALGQDLYEPPTAQGWAGGLHWINTASIVGRQRLVHDLLNDEKKMGTPLNPAATAARYGHHDAKAAQTFYRRLALQDDLTRQIPEQESLKAYVIQLFMRPEFQLA